MRSERLEPFAGVSHLRGEAADYRRIGRAALVRVLFDMHLVRAFEQQLLYCVGRDEVPGPVHTSIGQESVPATVLRHLGPRDSVVGSHRAHHHFLVRTLAHTVAAAWDPLTERIPYAASMLLTRAFCEMLGRADGGNQGIGGSMHLRDAVVGFQGSSAIVGGGLPIAAGLAFAEALRGTGACAVCFVGDGAVNQGTFHETANLAGVLRLPLLIVVENNGYAEATRPAEVTAVLPLAGQGTAHGLNAAYVHGSDIAAVDGATASLLAGVRAGDGPAIIEVLTYRHLDHVGPASGSAAGYRSTQEESAWRRRDPITTLPRTLCDLGLLTPGEGQRIEDLAQEVVAQAFDAVPSTSAVMPVLDESALLRGLPVSEVCEFIEAPAPRPRWTFREAIAHGLAQALRRRPEVVLLGEEVTKPGGLLWQAGCLDQELVGTRVLDMPISEASFVGLAGGAAMAGLRPIVELMYGSFALIAADQLFNHIGLIRALYGGTAQAPVIVRAKVPIGLGYGPQHGLNPAGLFRSFPGWRVFAPADPREYLGVLNSALDCPDPVLLVEFSPLYDDVFTVSDADFAAKLPLEGMRFVRRGTDVTLLSYGIGVSWTLAAAEVLAAHGCSAEVIDLRALDSPAMDWKTLVSAVSRTQAAVFVDPAARGQAIGPRVIADLVSRHRLQFPMDYVACADVQPVAAALERQATADVPKIVHTVRRLLEL